MFDSAWSFTSIGPDAGYPGFDPACVTYGPVPTSSPVVAPGQAVMPL